MAGLAGCCGCLFGCVGVTKVFNAISEGTNLLRREVEPIRGPDTRAKQISRIAANTLLFAGSIALAWAALSISATLFSVGATAGLIVGLQQGLALALPKLIIAVGTLVGGTVLNRLGGGPVYNPQDQVARIQAALNQARAGRVG